MKFYYKELISFSNEDERNEISAAKSTIEFFASIKCVWLISKLIDEI